MGYNSNMDSNYNFYINTMVEIALFALVVNALLAFKLWWDKKAKDKGRVINHTLSAAIDTTLYLITGCILFSWGAVGWVVIALGYRWIVFDLLFNVINNWHWANCGNSSWLDVKGDLLDGKDDNRCYLVFLPKAAVIAIGILIINFL